MKIEIITPQEQLYVGEARSVQVPGSKGSFEILENHAPIISTIDKGQIKIVEIVGGEKYFDVDSGIIEVKDNIISLAIEV